MPSSPARDGVDFAVARTKKTGALKNVHWDDALLGPRPVRIEDEASRLAAAWPEQRDPDLNKKGPHAADHATGRSPALYRNSPEYDNKMDPKSPLYDEAYANEGSASSARTIAGDERDERQRERGGVTRRSVSASVSSASLSPSLGKRARSRRVSRTPPCRARRPRPRTRCRSPANRAPRAKAL